MLNFPRQNETDYKMVAEDRSIEHAHRHPPSQMYLKNQMPHLNTGWDSFLFGKVKGFKFISNFFKKPQ